MPLKSQMIAFVTYNFNVPKAKRSPFFAKVEIFYNKLE
jgi:hypothetical protein